MVPLELLDDGVTLGASKVLGAAGSEAINLSNYLIFFGYVLEEF